MSVLLQLEREETKDEVLKVASSDEASSDKDAGTSSESDDLPSSSSHTVSY